MTGITEGQWLSEGKQKCNVLVSSLSTCLAKNCFPVASRIQVLFLLFPFFHLYWVAKGVSFTNVMRDNNSISQESYQTQWEHEAQIECAMAQRPGSLVQRPMFKCQLHQVWDVQPCTNSLISLGFSFISLKLISLNKIMIIQQTSIRWWLLFYQYIVKAPLYSVFSSLSCYLSV